MSKSWLDRQVQKAPPFSLRQMPHGSSQEGPSEAVRCVENSILLELLNPVPIPSNVQATPRISRDKHGNVKRALTMGQERDLATNLAFLAGISDNPNHIMSVCIEELPRLGGCQIVTAVNKCLPGDGDEVLNKVQRGFEQIFRRLKRVSPYNSTVVEEAVFNDIVALCRERILSRLKPKNFKTYYFKNKARFIGLVLQEFLRSPWRYRVDKRDPKMTFAHLERYQRRLEYLLAVLDSFEAVEVVRHEDLTRLVGVIALVTKAVPLERLLAGLTNQDMAPTARDRLLDCLTKTTRYRDLALFLCQKAEQLPMLRNVIVQKVQHPARSRINPLGRPTVTVNFEQSLMRFQYMGTPVQISTLPGWLTKAAVDSRRSFLNNVDKTCREAKVHAEIQLLVHYENVSDEVIPPRILASSKDACYLCHCLIKIHGKYEVPKSHGRLYRGWCLPAAYQEGPLQRKLNSFLELQIFLTLHHDMRLTRRPLTMFSNESTIFPIDLSASTLAGPQFSTVSSGLRFGVKDSKADQKTSQSKCNHQSHIEEQKFAKWGMESAFRGISGMMQALANLAARMST